MFKSPDSIDGFKGQKGHCNNIMTFSTPRTACKGGLWGFIYAKRKTPSSKSCEE